MHNESPQGDDELGDVRPLSAEQFYLLYQGVLQTESDHAYYRDAMLVLGMGRLGLREDTLAHLHEGWIDWDTGSILVPDHEPCSCERCVSRLESEITNTSNDHLEVLCPEKFWRPTSDEFARSIPFSWSRRLTCLLMNFFDRFDHPEFTIDADERLKKIANRVPALDGSRITSSALRASAAQTFAELDVDATALRDIVGATDVDEVEPFVRRAQSWGATPPLTPGKTFRDRYRVVGNPQQFSGEPCDPTSFGAKAREDRARKNVPTSSPVSNPRPSAAAIDPDPSLEAAAVEYLDAESEMLSLESDAVESFVDAHVERHDSRDESPDSQTEPTADRPGMGGPGAEPAASDGGAVPDVANEGAGTGASPRGAAGDRSGGRRSRSNTPDDGNDDERSRGRSHDVDGPEMVSASMPDVVDDPVANFRARYESALVTGSEPVTGTVVVEDDRLVFDVSDAPIQERAQTFVVPTGSLTDFQFDYQFDASTDGDAVSVGISWDATRETIGIEFDGEDNEFAGNLLVQMFDGRDALVSYPVRQGGRVNENTGTELATLNYDSGSIVAESSSTDEEIVEIPLSDVSSVDTKDQVYDGTTVQSVEIEFSVDGASRAAKIGFRDSRLTRLFSRFSKVHYRRKRQRMHSLGLTDSEKEYLVALHSMGGSAGGMSLEGMIDVDTDDFGAFVRELAEKGLVVEPDADTTLTGLGRTVVTEKIDDINF